MDIFQNIDDKIGKAVDSGDREVRTWFLVKQNTLPFALCGMYALFCTVIGPAIMRNRKPFTLRMPMIVFNAFLMLTYSIMLFQALTNLPQLSFTAFCKGTTVKKGDVTYKLAACCWVIYILKYLEFLDTVFFILRKKMGSVTFLHVIHHTIVPILGWILLRTETSGIQSIPVMINAFVHVIMYAYYGLSAIGPRMRPYLWWKKYLTIIQMIQFVFILLFATVIAPISGCNIAKTSITINVVGGFAFLLLFYNFYSHTFGRKTKTARTVRENAKMDNIFKKKEK